MGLGLRWAVGERERARSRVISTMHPKFRIIWEIFKLLRRFYMDYLPLYHFFSPVDWVEICKLCDGEATTGPV